MIEWVDCEKKQLLSAHVPVVEDNEVQLVANLDYVRQEVEANKGRPEASVLGDGGALHCQAAVQCNVCRPGILGAVAAASVSAAEGLLY